MSEFRKNKFPNWLILFPVRDAMANSEPENLSRRPKTLGYKVLISFNLIAIFNRNEHTFPLVEYGMIYAACSLPRPYSSSYIGLFSIGASSSVTGTMADMYPSLANNYKVIRRNVIRSHARFTCCRSFSCL